jgi:hypothetical protein
MQQLSPFNFALTECFEPGVVMRVRVLLVSTIMAGGVAMGGLAPGAAYAADRDCGDFPSQRAAQIFYLNNNPAADPHRLDDDGDGVACESNPAPYYYGSDPTPGGGGDPSPQPQPVVIRVVKVINGQYIKVREGNKAPVVVHLLGVIIPKQSCERRTAVKDLRSWVKPGMVVKVHKDKKAPNRDAKGILWRALERVKGGYDIGGSQIATGFGNVERDIRFTVKTRYLRWETKAINRDKGYHGSC